MNRLFNAVRFLIASHSLFRSTFLFQTYFYGWNCLANYTCGSSHGFPTDRITSGITFFRFFWGFYFITNHRLMAVPLLSSRNFYNFLLVQNSGNSNFRAIRVERKQKNKHTELFFSLVVMKLRSNLSTYSACALKLD